MRQKLRMNFLWKISDLQSGQRSQYLCTEASNSLGGNLKTQLASDWLFCPVPGSCLCLELKKPPRNALNWGSTGGWVLMPSLSSFLQMNKV